MEIQENKSKEENMASCPSPLGQNKWLFYGLLAVGIGYYLWGWHKEHVLQYWPLGIILLCPLMHLFMHRGHGSHNHHIDEQSRS